MRPIKRNLAIAGTGLAVLAAGGGAYAATQHNNASSNRQAFLNDAARRLHVTPQQLENALRGAALDRLDAAVKAGKLTQQQANAIKQRLQSGAKLGLGLGPRADFHHGFGRFGFGFGFAKLDPAAKYLGLTEAQLRSQLASGKSLADIAKARGKSVTGLENALESALRARLDAAVKAGKLTKAQEQLILARIDQRIADVVQRSFAFRHHP